MTNDELKNLLRNYQHERATIADMLKQMAKAAGVRVLSGPPCVAED